MGLRLRAMILTAFLAAAAYSGYKVYGNLDDVRMRRIPSEVYSQFDSETAEYYIRDCGGYVAVYGTDRGSAPISVTTIETAFLRRGDRAMVEAGIPVGDRKQLLLLLEDLGS